MPVGGGSGEEVAGRWPRVDPEFVELRRRRGPPLRRTAGMQAMVNAHASAQMIVVGRSISANG